MDAEPGAVRPVTLAVAEVLDRDGHVRWAVPIVAWPVTIGRAVDCDVVLDDVHAAARHATLAETGGGLTLEVGDTINGVSMAGRRLAALQQADLPTGAVFEVGHTRLRVRRANDALAPERPLQPDPGRSRIPVFVLGVAAIAWAAWEQWLNADPGSRLTDYLPPLVGLPLTLAVWSGFWSVGSKLVRHRFDFLPHAYIALRYSLAMSLVGLLLPLMAFSLGWTFLSRVSGLAVTAITVAMVLAHLTLILPARRRTLAAVAAVLLVAGVSLYLVRNYQLHDRVFTQLYVTTLGPPALRVAPAVAPTRFIEESRALQEVLDAHARDENEEGSP